MNDEPESTEAALDILGELAAEAIGEERPRALSAVDYIEAQSRGQQAALEEATASAARWEQLASAWQSLALALADGDPDGVLAAFESLRPLGVGPKQIREMIDARRVDGAPT